MARDCVLHVKLHFRPGAHGTVGAALTAPTFVAMESIHTLKEHNYMDYWNVELLETH